MSTWRRVWRLARPLVGLGLAGLAVVVLLGRKGELSGIATSFSHIDDEWIPLAVAAEALSMVSFALVARRLLAEAHSPLGTGPLLAIALAGNAVTNSLPVGPAFGAAYAFRRYHERGVSDIVAGWVLVGVAALTAAGLAVLASIGVAAALGQSTALGLAGVILGVLAATGVFLGLLRRPQLLASALRAGLRVSRRLVRRPGPDADQLVERMSSRLASVTPTWRGLSIALGWALGNWLLDLACLVCAFGAVDSPVPWRGLLLAYGAAQLAANLPITPGGLGVVEGSLTIGLVAYGGAEASSVAAVLVYRVISFWALLIVGWVVAGGLAVSTRRHHLEEAAKLEEVGT